MEAIITLDTPGGPVKAEKLRSYFDKLFQAEDSGTEFPCDLDHVYKLSDASRDNAVRRLKKGFEEGADYQVSSILAENPKGGRPKDVYMLSVSCMEYLTVRANREVFEVYRNCRKAIKNILRGSMPDFSDPVAAARAWADAEEGKRKALAEASVAATRLEQARPKIEFADAVAIAANSIPMSAAAKHLKLQDPAAPHKILGRNKLFRMLRNDGILQRNNEPYQHQVDAGHFEVEPQHYKAGEKGERIAGTTRVTGKGLQYLSKRYREKTSS